MKKLGAIKKWIVICCSIILCFGFSIEFKAQVGWGNDANGVYYMLDEDTKATNWQKIGGKWYYFGSDGVMKTGWQQVSGEWYYLASNGEMLTGWQKLGDNWYYLNSNGCWINDNSAETGTMKGIDVSKWQGDINWKQVKNAGVEYAFIRIGHGNRSLDKYYESNMKGANEAGIPAGVYFYSTAKTEEQAILDAQFVIDNLKGYLISYPVAIDLEDSSQVELGKDRITDIAIAFCDEIRAAGYTPMIYCNEYWYKNYIDFSRLDNVEHWIARYNVKPSSSIPRGIWQCGSTGRIPGINGNVDIDFAYKDYTKIITPRYDVLSSYKKTNGVWITDKNGKWYKYLTGGYPYSKWEKIDDKWYWFNKEGYSVTGWLKRNNYWYYLGPDGAMKTGWQKINGIWYYLGPENDGVMRTGWKYIGGNYYYLDTSGAMQTGWERVAGKWYYLDSSGVMKTGWQKINGYWYYLGTRYDGTMKTGWQKVGSEWYYMYSDGRMAANTWIGNYYVNSSGAWVASR